MIVVKVSLVPVCPLTAEEIADKQTHRLFSTFSKINVCKQMFTLVSAECCALSRNYSHLSRLFVVVVNLELEHLLRIFDISDT